MLVTTENILQNNIQYHKWAAMSTASDFMPQIMISFKFAPLIIWCNKFFSIFQTVGPLPVVVTYVRL